MQMISADDLYYLKRVENLEKQYRKCADKINELNKVFDDYLSTENFSIYDLNIILDQKETAKELKKAIENEIQKLKFGALN